MTAIKKQGSRKKCTLCGHTFIAFGGWTNSGVAYDVTCLNCNNVFSTYDPPAGESEPKEETPTPTFESYFVTLGGSSLTAMEIIDRIQEEARKGARFAGHFKMFDNSTKHHLIFEKPIVPPFAAPETSPFAAPERVIRHESELDWELIVESLKRFENILTTEPVRSRRNAANLVRRIEETLSAVSGYVKS